MSLRETQPKTDQVLEEDMEKTEHRKSLVLPPPTAGPPTCEVEAIVNVRPTLRNYLSLSLTDPMTDSRISFLCEEGHKGHRHRRGDELRRTPSSLSASAVSSATSAAANRYFASPTSPSFLHLGQLKTGVVSRVIRAIGDSRLMRSRMFFKHSTTAMNWCRPPQPSPLRHQVRTLARDFEDGTADRIGPLKLYHAETYKRELKKITSNRLGRVFRRIRRFEFLSTSDKLLTDRQNHEQQPQLTPSKDGERRASLARASADDQTPDEDALPSSAPPTIHDDRRFSRKQSFIAAITGDKPPCLDINDNISDESLVKAASRNGYSVPGKKISAGRTSLASDGQPTVHFDATSESLVSRRSDASTADTSPEDHVIPFGAKASEKGQRRSLDSKWSAKHIQACMKSRSETAISAFTAESEDAVWLEGELKVKQISLEDGAKCPDHSWKDTWAVLVQNVLYLCPDRPDASAAKSEVLQSIKGNAISALDVSSSIVDIAYGKTKRKNVFRCVTKHHTEHLFQAKTSEEMMRWIEALQRCSYSEDLEAISSSSLDVIMKRYEKMLQSTSPSKRPSLKGLRKTARSISAIPVDTMSELYSAAELPTSTTTLPPTLTAKLEKGRKSKHRKKSKESVPVNGTVKTGSVFGRQLERCLTTSETDYVPFIVRLCVAVVEAFGINMIGVYRIPGNTAAVHSLSAKANEGFENIDFTDMRWRDVNVVSSLLKAFFRNLPEPLLTNELYFHFIEASRFENSEERLTKLTQLVHQLPQRNFETLKFLMYHLRKIVAYSHINKMEARNLALMFGPSIVRCDDADANTMVWHTQDHCNVVETFITNIKEARLYQRNIVVFTRYHCSKHLLPGTIQCERIFGSEKNDDHFVQKHSYELCGTRIENLLQVMDAAEKAEQTRAVHSLMPCASVKQSQTDDSSKPILPRGVDHQERNIDEEIVRRRSCVTMERSDMNADEFTASTSASPGHENEADASGRQRCKPRKPSKYSSEGDLSKARRIFLTGTSAEVLQTASIAQSLADHCRHLNVHPDCQDILSPETREKIKRVSREIQPLENNKPLATMKRSEISSATVVGYSSSFGADPSLRGALPAATDHVRGSPLANLNGPASLLTEARMPLSSTTSIAPGSDDASPQQLFNRARLRRVVPRSLLQNCDPNTVQKQTITSW